MGMVMPGLGRTLCIVDWQSRCSASHIQANNIKVQELADEQGLKVAQNVAAGVVGLVIWPVWFAMDAKGAASKDVAALQARQQYLAILATERCKPEPEPKPTVRSKPKPQTKPIAQAPITQPAQTQ